MLISFTSKDENHTKTISVPSEGIGLITFSDGHCRVFLISNPEVYWVIEKEEYNRLLSELNPNLIDDSIPIEEHILTAEQAAQLVNNSKEYMSVEKPLTYLLDRIHRFSGEGQRTFRSLVPEKADVPTILSKLHALGYKAEVVEKLGRDNTENLDMFQVSW